MLKDATIELFDHLIKNPKPIGCNHSITTGSQFIKQMSENWMVLQHFHAGEALKCSPNRYNINNESAQFSLSLSAIVKRLMPKVQHQLLKPLMQDVLLYVNKVRVCTIND